MIRQFAVLCLVIGSARSAAGQTQAACPNGQCQRPAAVQYTPQQIAHQMGEVRRANGRWILNPNRKMPWAPQYRRGGGR
jgi:hypothetical protein